MSVATASEKTMHPRVIEDIVRLSSSFGSSILTLQTMQWLSDEALHPVAAQYIHRYGELHISQV
jgi:hypothetical protein